MELVRKHLLTILCALAILLLLLPIASVSVEVDSAFVSTSQSKSVTGLNALGGSFFAWFLVLGPAVLIAMNYLKPLEKYKGLLAIAVPVANIVALIIVICRAKAIQGGAGTDAASVEVSTRIGIGSILLFLTYLGTIVAGAIEFHNFSISKEGFEKLKKDATGAFSNAQEKITGTVQNVADKATSKKTAATNQADGQSSTPHSSSQRSAGTAPQSRAVNLDRTDEILTLIEKLAKMKNEGILTEEEFSSKKAQLLEEIK